jgi:hypothetical protein
MPSLCARIAAAQRLADDVSGRSSRLAYAISASFLADRFTSFFSPDRPDRIIRISSSGENP